jgi:hypothetical protein
MNSHSISDSICNIVNLEYSRKLQGMTNKVKFAFSIGETTFNIRDTRHAVYN